MRKKVTYIVVLFITLITFQVDAQCAMCKAVVENGDVSMAEGVNSGITYLMVFPYILVGILMYTIYRYKRTSKN